MARHRMSSSVIYFWEIIIRLDERLAPAGEHAGLSSTWSQIQGFLVTRPICYIV